MNRQITSYLPRLLLDWYASKPPTECHRYTRHSGTLLFADTSGFTALTRVLGRQGKIGFETLTHLLNGLFRALESATTPFAGDILKFSGDAVWCLLPETAPVERVFARMLYAVERLNDQTSICRQHPLSLHAGAVRGEFALVTFGDPANRLEFEIVGSKVMQAYSACDLAKAGEIALHSSINTDRATMRGERGESDYRIVRPASEPFADSSDSVMLPSDPTTGDLAMVEKYLPQVLLARKRERGSSQVFGSEHRQVAALFAELRLPSSERNVPDESLIANANAKIIEIMEVIRNHNGIVARVDPFADGHKLLALFGALAKSNSDKLNALQAGVDVARQSCPESRVRVGLAAGPLYCGEVGSDLRHEYTVMGEAVNLAARLMSRASEGDVLLNDALYESLRDVTDISEVRVNLKGIGDEVVVYKFDSWRQTAIGLPAVPELVGREDTLAELQSVWDSRTGDSAKYVLLSGEPGVGKTSVSAAFARKVSEQGTVYLSAYGSQLHHPGWLITELLKAECAGTEMSAGQCIDTVAFLRSRVEPNWLPLFDQLTGRLAPDNEWTRGLSPELRIAKLSGIVSNLLASNCDDRLIIIDDMESADSLSVLILKELVKSSSRCKSMLILVGSGLDEFDRGEHCRQIHLDGLDHDALTELIGARFVKGARELELTKLLIERSEGNPLYIGDTLDQLTTSGAIGNLTDPVKCDVLKPLDEIILADRLEDLQLSRLDALPESHRQVLKMASVIGGKFTAKQLRGLIEQDYASAIAGILDELCAVGLLSCDPAVGSYNVSRELTKQAIYNCIPQTDLGPLHRQIAEMFLAEEGMSDVLRIAFHFSRCDDPVRAFDWSLKAAEFARSSGLLVEAAAYFSKCDRILGGDAAGEIGITSQVEFYRQATDFALQDGNYSDARRYAHYWRKLSLKLNQMSSCHAAVNALARILWKQSRYVRCQQVLDKILAQDQTEESRSQLAESYSLLGELQRRTGKLAEAQTSCHRAVELARSGVDRLVESDATNNLGLALWSSGDLAGARECFLRSLELRAANESKYAEARVANNTAIISEEMGDYVEARRLAKNAKDIFMEIGDRRNQAYASGTLANLLVSCGWYREATELYHSADRIFVKSGETHPHYYTLGNLGDLDLLLGFADDAFAKYQEVFAFAKDAGDQELLAEMAVRFAEHTYYYLNQQAEAVALYEKAIETAKNVGSLEFQVRGTIGLCRVLIGIRDMRKTDIAIGQLIEYARESKSDRTRYEAEFLTGELLRIMGRNSSAASYYRNCIAYAEKQQQFELTLEMLHTNVRGGLDFAGGSRSRTQGVARQFPCGQRIGDAEDGNEFPLLPIFPTDVAPSIGQRRRGDFPIGCWKAPIFSPKKLAVQFLCSGRAQDIGP